MMYVARVALTTFALGLSLRVFSATDREKRISDLEKQMMEIGAFNKNQTFGAVFGPSKPITSKGEVFFDLLVYKASVGGTEIVCRNLDRYEENRQTIQANKVDTLSFDWSLGFRVGATKENIYQECGLSIDYTYFKTKGKEGHRGDLPVSLALISSEIQPHIGAYSNYSLSYQNINLDLSKGYFISENILFYSFAGLKGSLISQKQDSQGVLSVKFPASFTYRSNLEDRCKFYGVGPRVGCQSRWYMFKDFSFLTKFAGSLLYGYYKLKDEYLGEETLFDGSSPKLENSRIDLKGSFHSFCPFVETTLGLSWNKSFKREKYILTLAACYEILFFWRQSKSLIGEGILYKGVSNTDLRSIGFSRRSEDVSLSGLMFEIGLDF